MRDKFYNVLNSRQGYIAESVNFVPWLRETRIDKASYELFLTSHYVACVWNARYYAHYATFHIV